MARATPEEYQRLGRIFAENLSHLREAANLTPDELSQRASVLSGWIRHLESGDGLPRIITAIRIADALGVGTERLMVGLTLR